ncbi:MAG: hypothetical protein LBE57_00415, partial [Methanosarcinales archaeon]|nr:hypothetical protein [Methanosarcinales archaeon]
AKAEPVKAKAEPVKAKAEPVKAKAEPVKAKAEPVKAKAESVKAKAEPVKVKAEPAKAEPAEEPVKSMRGRKPKAAAEEVSVEEEPAKKTKTTRTSKAVEEPAEEPKVAEEPVKGPAKKSVKESAPKRKYTRRKKADDDSDDDDFEEDDSEEDDTDEDDEIRTPSRKPGRKSKAEKEVEAAESDDGADIETKVYNLIKNTPGGVYQNEIWKQLNIDSRKCSRILKKLLDSNQIIREEAVVGGTKTYLLKTVAEERKRNYDVLMVNGMFSPCTGCMGECRPEYCPALTLWIMNIHENPQELYVAMGYGSNAEAPEQAEVEMPPEFLEGMEAGEYELADEDDEDLVFE